MCVAYCEALDCPDLAAGPSSERQPQCSPPNPDILARYNDLKTDNDPPMPCVQPQPQNCPCWSDNEMSAIGYTHSPHTMYAALWDFEAYDSFALAEYRSGYPGAYQYGQVYYWNEGPQCVYAYADFDPESYEYIVRFQEITTAQALACEASIKDQYQLLIDSGEIVPCGGNLCPGL